MLTLYDYLPSQNGYKIRLLLNQLERPYHSEIISIFEGAGQAADYRAINPTGAVPAIRLEDGRTLTESNAILMFLAEGSIYLPDDLFTRAKVLQWTSFEADYAQSSIGTLRHWIMTGKVARRPPETVDALRSKSLKVLSILEQQFSERRFIVGGDYSVADISLFAYVHRAEEAELSLTPYPQLCAWIDRVAAQPRFEPTVHPYAIDPHASKELP